MSKKLAVIEIGFGEQVREATRAEPVDGPGGDRQKGGTSPTQALVWNVGTWGAMARENSEWQPHEGGQYRCVPQGRTGP
jgi:hypothetical protein